MRRCERTSNMKDEIYMSKCTWICLYLHLYVIVVELWSMESTLKGEIMIPLSLPLFLDFQMIVFPFRL